jgi:hypothetical protein
MTRAISVALHGQFREAFQLHPLWPLATAILAVAAALLILDGVRGSSLASSCFRATLTRRLALLSIVALAGVTIHRVLSSC